MSRIPSFLYRFLKPEARTRLFVELVERSNFSAARRLLALTPVGSARGRLLVNDEVPSPRHGGLTTAFRAALLDGSLELVQALLRQGAHVNLRSEDRNSICLAAESTLDRRGKLRAVVEAGANPDMSVAPSRRTLLTRAILARDESLARFLIERGAAVGRPDSSGLTPYKAARLMGSRDVEQWLTEKGAAATPPTTSDVESAFIVSRALWSQIHESVKTALSAARISTDSLDLEWPAEELILVYHLSREGHRARLRLEILADSSITLLYFGEDGSPRDLLPDAAAVDGAALRAHLTMALSSYPDVTASPRRPRARNAERARATAPRTLTEAERAAFDLLELEPSASPGDIAAAYRRLAKVFHPDLADGSDPRRMQELNRAYETLKK